MADQNEVRAVVVGSDQVVNAWKTMNDDCPYFAVFYAKTRHVFFQYNRDDMQRAEDFLRNNLNALESEGDNQLLYLNMYPDAKATYGNTGMIASLPFRLNPYDRPAMSGPGYPGNDSMMKMLNDAHLQQLKLTEEIAKLKYENQPLDWFDKIGGMMENPAAAQTIGALLAPVIQGLMGIVAKVSGQPIAPAASQGYAMGIAGPNNEIDTDMDAKLDQALDRLSVHGDLVEMLTALADYAEKNPAQFKMYLSMLK